MRRSEPTRDERLRTRVGEFKALDSRVTVNVSRWGSEVTRQRGNIWDTVGEILAFSCFYGTAFKNMLWSFGRGIEPCPPSVRFFWSASNFLYGKSARSFGSNRTKESKTRTSAWFFSSFGVQSKNVSKTDVFLRFKKEPNSKRGWKYGSPEVPQCDKRKIK